MLSADEVDDEYEDTGPSSASASPLGAIIGAAAAVGLLGAVLITWRTRRAKSKMKGLDEKSFENFDKPSKESNQKSFEKDGMDEDMNA